MTGSPAQHSTCVSSASRQWTVWSAKQCCKVAPQQAVRLDEAQRGALPLPGGACLYSTRVSLSLSKTSQTAACMTACKVLANPRHVLSDTQIQIPVQLTQQRQCASQ